MGYFILTFIAGLVSELTCQFFDPGVDGELDEEGKEKKNNMKKRSRWFFDTNSSTYKSTSLTTTLAQLYGAGGLGDDAVSCRPIGVSIEMLRPSAGVTPTATLVRALCC